MKVLYSSLSTLSRESKPLDLLPVRPRSAIARTRTKLLEEDGGGGPWEVGLMWKGSRRRRRWRIRRWVGRRKGSRVERV